MRFKLTSQGAIFTSFLLCLAAVANPAAYDVKVPLGLVGPKIPSNNPVTEEKVALGKKLFYDESFSFNGHVACATCHIPEHGFADITPIGFTSAGGQLARNTPTSINAALNDFQFWDGRAASLEAQVADVARPAGDTSININTAIKSCNSNPEYVAMFQKAFNSPPTPETFCQAISSYERTTLSGDTRFDRFLFKGEKDALTPLEKKGYEVFTNKGNCTSCHTIVPPAADKPGNATFIDQKFHNIGIGAYGTRMKDAGRYYVTGERSDFGAFKTPTLRNVDLTSPYMHDGSLATLEKVVDYYDRGGNANKGLDPLMKPLHMTKEEKKALVAFLKTLSDDKLKKEYLPVKQIQARINKVLKQ
ncbi:MAG TPA: cytochrome c peroxidase [Drouetiella sp.]|jgi:cytochrome c peroxidase